MIFTGENEQAMKKMPFSFLQVLIFPMLSELQLIPGKTRVLERMVLVNDFFMQK
jgi:hypothetical protein